jgi:tetratricopeptide (TPR) repeat protein
MNCTRLAFPVVVVLLLALSSAQGQVALLPGAVRNLPEQKKGKKDRADPGKKGGDKMPLTGLAPAKLAPNLCVVKYRVSTASPECQEFFDQGLGYFYSYVWMEAARCFETAAKHDPDCAMAWWGLSRALERYGRSNHTEALKKAQALLPRCSHRENLLITARLQEKGLVAGVGDTEGRKKAATQTLDTLLALYDDDEEGWFARAQLAGGGGIQTSAVAAAPFYKALLRINPLHPGANHELVHFYENFKRPALGMPYADKYIESSPGIPHAWHMQAHLATRVGRWDKTVDRSARAVELHREYQKTMQVSHNQDQQFSHHLETLLLGLIHDGRFAEARKLKAECEGYKIIQRQPWFRLHLAERAWDDALKMAGQSRKGDKLGASYMTALVYLRKGDLERAAPEVAVLQQAYASDKRGDKTLEMRLWETQGMLMCMQGQAEGGLKLLQKLVDKTKDDYRHHSWGNGAVYMEWWGAAALAANKLDVAEEAFLEALAHDRGSVRGALGMQVVCERQGRTEEAARFAELAARCWCRATPESLAAELAALRGTATTAQPLQTTTPKQKIEGQP